MIRLVYVLRRRAGMSREEFQDYWQNVHGPLVAKHSTRLKIHRYTQLHTLEDPVNDALAEARGGMEEPYDGVAELWWETPEDLASLGEGPGADAALELLEDEKEFIDLPGSPLWMAYEYPQVNPSEYIVATQHSPLVKLFFCLRPLPDQALEECQLYWRTQHGPLIRALAPGYRLQRYLQVHYCAHEAETALREVRGTTAEAYAGHAEIWFNRSDLMAIADTPEARHASELAVADESRFIDFQRSAMFIGKERVFIDRR